MAVAETEIKTELELTTYKTDWMVYVRFFETVNGVDGYFRLRDYEPRLLKKIMEAFHIDLSDSKSVE